MKIHPVYPIRKYRSVRFLETNSRSLQSRPRRSIRRHVWRRFHAWTLLTIALLTSANAYSVLRPFESSNDPLAHPQQINQLARQSGVPLPAPGREPAATGLESKRPGNKGNIAELRVPCDPTVNVTVAISVNSLRLQLAECNARSPASIPAYYVWNETNGFEGTVFRIPDSPNRISTDYITLEKGENKIRISRSIDSEPAIEQTVHVLRPTE